MSVTRLDVIYDIADSSGNIVDSGLLASPTLPQWLSSSAQAQSNWLIAQSGYSVPEHTAIQIQVISYG